MACGERWSSRGLVLPRCEYIYVYQRQYYAYEGPQLVGGSLGKIALDLIIMCSNEFSEGTHLPTPDIRNRLNDALQYKSRLCRTVGQAPQCPKSVTQSLPRSCSRRLNYFEIIQRWVKTA